MKKLFFGPNFSYAFNIHVSRGILSAYCQLNFDYDIKRGIFGTIFYLYIIIKDKTNFIAQLGQIKIKYEAFAKHFPMRDYVKRKKVLT